MEYEEDEILDNEETEYENYDDLVNDDDYDEPFIEDDEEEDE